MKDRYEDPCLDGILIIICCLILIRNNFGFRLVGLKRVKGWVYSFFYKSRVNKKSYYGQGSSVNRFKNYVPLWSRGTSLKGEMENRLGFRNFSTTQCYLGKKTPMLRTPKGDGVAAQGGVEVKITDLKTNITVHYGSITKAAKAINTTAKSLTQYINTPGIGGIKLPYRDRYFIENGRYNTTTFNSPNSVILKNTVFGSNDPCNERNIILKETKGKIGVYAWVNKLNSKIYVCGGTDLHKVISDYYQPGCLLTSKIKMLKVFNKYGMINFRFVILEYTEKDKLVSCLTKWIVLLKPEYNINPEAENRNKEKISTMAKGESTSGCFFSKNLQILGQKRSYSTVASKIIGTGLAINANKKSRLPNNIEKSYYDPVNQRELIRMDNKGKIGGYMLEKIRLIINCMLVPEGVVIFYM